MGCGFGIMVNWSWAVGLLSHTSSWLPKLVEKIELDVPARAFSQLWARPAAVEVFDRLDEVAPGMTKFPLSRLRFVPPS